MKKLSDTMKHLEDMKYFVKNEERKRRYSQEGLEIPTEENHNKSKNLPSRDYFIKDKEQNEKFNVDETSISTEIEPVLNPFDESERCINFEDFIKIRKKE